jgi:hypothetical protein
MVTMPAALYGTHSRAKYCPIRETTTLGVSSNEAVLQSVLLSAEVYLAGQTSNNANGLIFRRKALIYRTMNKMVSDPNVLSSGRVFTALAAAGVAEARLGNVLEARLHLKLIKRLLGESNGASTIQKLESGATVPVVMALVSIGTGDTTFTTIAELQCAEQKFVATFRAMQMWNYNMNIKYRTNFECYCDSCRGIFHPSASELDQSHLNTLGKYQSSRLAAFFDFPFLRPFVETDFSDTNPVQNRCHMAILYILNKTLWELRHDYAETVRFWSKLTATVRSGHIPSTKETTRENIVPSLKAIAVVFILADCAASYGKKTDHNGGILRSLEAIDAVELMELLSKESRRRILDHLSSWIILKDVPIMTEHDLNLIEDEITLNWMMRRVGRGGNSQRFQNPIVSRSRRSLTTPRSCAGVERISIC